MKAGKNKVYFEAFSKSNPPRSSDILQTKCVGICGAGGLGSNIALSLARSCIGKIIIADFDRVEPGNLNRQQFFMEHIGQTKVEAVADMISRISPFTEVKTHFVKITEENAPALFNECDAIAEAFDKAEQKKMLIETLQTGLGHIPLVAASGMAGLDEANKIQTNKYGNLFICGDMVSEATKEAGLTASRVSICANHQAHQILRLLLGL
jgi:sulfur carrier protein ThiS adenylyltransferase